MASAKEIADKTGAKVTPVVADHSKPEGRQALLTACPEPDIMVTTISTPPIIFGYNKLTEDDWYNSINLGLIGPVELMPQVTAGMSERRWDRIVNIGTVAAKLPMQMRLLSGPCDQR